MKNFPIILEQDEDGIFIISCPLFKGCHSYGNTKEEAMINIREAIELCLEDEQPINTYLEVNEIELA